MMYPLWVKIYELFRTFTDFYRLLPSLTLFDPLRPSLTHFDPLLMCFKAKDPLLVCPQIFYESSFPEKKNIQCSFSYRRFCIFLDCCIGKCISIFIFVLEKNFFMDNYLIKKFFCRLWIVVLENGQRFLFLLYKNFFPWKSIV